MKKRYLLLIVVAIIGVFEIVKDYNNNSLQQQYVNVLEKQEKEYIDSFYKSSFKGVITYIQSYEKNPDKYVISVTDLLKNEKTIGKVEITNFSNAVKGDTLYKKANSFKIETAGKSGKFISLIKYSN